MVKRFLILLFALFVGGFYLYQAPTTPIQKADQRFYKVDRNGKALSPWQGPWSCVYDKQQKRLWQVKTDNESIHDGYWTYSWFDGKRGVENAGDCYFEADRCDTLDLIQHVNAQSLCGLKQWRLPTHQELTQLITKNDRFNENSIATDFFPQMQRGDYWTSDHSVPLNKHYQALKEGAVAVNFQQRTSPVLPYQNAAFVILVNDKFTTVVNPNTD